MCRDSDCFLLMLSDLLVKSTNPSASVSDGAFMWPSRCNTWLHHTCKHGWVCRMPLLCKDHAEHSSDTCVHTHTHKCMKSCKGNPRRKTDALWSRSWLPLLFRTLQRIFYSVYFLFFQPFPTILLRPDLSASRNHPHWWSSVQDCLPDFDQHLGAQQHDNSIFFSGGTSLIKWLYIVCFSRRSAPHLFFRVTWNQFKRPSSMFYLCPPSANLSRLSRHPCAASWFSSAQLQVVLRQLGVFCSCAATDSQVHADGCTFCSFSLSSVLLDPGKRGRTSGVQQKNYLLWWLSAQRVGYLSSNRNKLGWGGRHGSQQNNPRTRFPIWSWVLTKGGPRRECNLQKRPKLSEAEQRGFAFP